MKLIHDKSEKELIRVLRNPLFSKVTDYLYENRDVTLRQLTVAFTEKGFIKFLESCIEIGVILREQRRYCLGVPVFTELDYQEAVEDTPATTFISLAAASSLELCQWYQQQFAHLSESFPPFFITDDVKLAQVHKINNEKLAIWSVNTVGPDSRDLPGYFSANRQLLEPVAFDELRKLVGDVDEDYFLGQVGWIISRVLREKNPRPNIFLSALYEAKVLSKENESNFKLEIPQLSVKKYDETTENKEEVTSKSHFDRVSLYSEVCQRYCNGFMQWLELN